jgi:hypothetical protein
MEVVKANADKFMPRKYTQDIQDYAHERHRLCGRPGKKEIARALRANFAA